MTTTVKPRPVRVTQTVAYDDPVTSVRYVDANRAKALARLGITTVRDLLENYPKRYIDLSRVERIEGCEIGSKVTVVGRIGEIRTKRPRPRLTLVEASVIDETGCLMVTWFGQPWVTRQISVGDLVSVSGKVTFDYGYLRMNTPLFEVLDSVADERDARPLGRIVPVHPLTADITGAWMRRFIQTALPDVDSTLDPLPADIRISRDLVPRHVAYGWMHFPQTMEQAQAARRRLAYEELIVLQCHMLMRRREEDARSHPFAHIVDGPASKALTLALPFTLTPDQAQAVVSIQADMALPSRMDRMLLGDVGTGKTAVAAFALSCVHDSCTQAAMMAPTSVLATQYATKLGPVLDGIGVSWALLTGATSARDRADILSRLAAGRIDVLFGTHALIQPDVAFRHLTLTVIDEQHRFGVEQRQALFDKGPGCDRLLMTATPIPRTLALMLYGDLDCTYLRKRPLSRKPVETALITSKDRADVYEVIRDEVGRGHQAYIVCPLIGVKGEGGDEGRQDMGALMERGRDLSDAKAAVSQASFLQAKVFPNLHVGLLTGRMPSSEKCAVMDDFRAKRIDILVSTTVIEVGVDVPDATVMLIEDADCFGLSQLHQLRGRVGRGEAQGRVFLACNLKDEDASRRLSVLTTTDDGFELATTDLEMRHEGDVLGRRQSGHPVLPLVDVTRDGELIGQAHHDAHALIADDPELSGCRTRLLGFEVARLRSRIEEG